MILQPNAFPRKLPPGVQDATDPKGRAPAHYDGSLGVNRARQVRCNLWLGGVKIPRFSRWEKNEAASSAAGTIDVTVSMQDLDTMFDVFAVSMTVLPLPILVETTMTINGKKMFDDADEFNGVVDRIEADYNAGVYHITGRSYAQILMNAKLTETFSSTADAPKKTWQVVQEVVKKYGQGLKAVVDQSFTTSVGQIYKEQLVKAVVNISAWDLLESFAQKDHADLFVKGDTVYYVKKPTDTAADITTLNGTKPSYTFIWGYNIKKLKVEHSPMFSHDITVTVKSYQPRTGQTYTKTVTMSDAKVAALARQLETTPEAVKPKYDASKAKFRSAHKELSTSGKVAAAKIGNKENYTFTIPNASQEDCDRVALRIMEDISRKEFIVTLEVLAQPDYSARQYIKIEGTSSPTVNQVYAIKNIKTVCEMPDDGADASGYTTTFTLINHAVQSTGAALGS